jgi:hypothetical protein
MEIEIGYAWSQLQEAKRAVGEAELGGDAEARARAEEKVRKWENVILGMQQGTLAVGSRTPTKAPAWVTLEVAKGGFATGSYLAGGPLRPHETKRAEALGLVAGRIGLNLHYLQPGRLSEALASGRYRLEVPEEGALLVVQWLRERGQDAAAEALAAELMPWFHVLRFYPILTEEAATRPPGAVRLQALAKTREQVAKPRGQQRLEQMREALTVWAPLHDRALELLLATVEGERPRTPRAGGPISGGHVGQRFPHGFAEQVAALSIARDKAGRTRTARARHVVELIRTLERWSRDPKSVTPQEAHLLRLELARHLSAHGAPGSAEHAAWRAEQRRSVAAPLHAELRAVVGERLVEQVERDHLDLEVAAAPVSAEEAARFGVPAGSAMPAQVIAKLERSWEAPLGELAARGVIPSSETLAQVLPQVTAQVRGETLADEAGRRLYRELYEVFRKRRGLLLLHYQHQVRFPELPWARALDERRAVDEAAAERARRLVGEASAVAIKAFPHTIVPNKLVTELYALSGAAELSLPLVEELAADIFMGSFTEKFAMAARTAATLLEGSLYQRYYGIDADAVRRLDVDPSPQPPATTRQAVIGPRLAPELAKLCEDRAFASGGRDAYGVARAGKILEQCQILTTHNLAVLFDALALQRTMGDDMRALAEKCARRVLHALRLPVRKWHEWLIRLKNAAYAWRQMMFFASLTGDAKGFARWLRERAIHEARKDAAFGARFEPAMRGLELAAAGVSSTSEQFAKGGGRVFTGWTTERHWLAPQALMGAKK